MGIKELSFKKEIERLTGGQRYLVLLGLLALFVVSLGCLYEDYRTTVAGLELIPGQAVNDWLRPLLGIAPTALQIVFVFVAVTQRNTLAALIALLAWLFDFGTDLAYRMQGVDPNPGSVAIVIFMCIMIASFFSEFMLMFTVPHIGYVLGPTIGAWLRTWWAGIRQVIKEAKESAGSSMMADAQRMMYPVDESDKEGDFDYEPNTVRKTAQRGYNNR